MATRPTPSSPPRFRWRAIVLTVAIGLTMFPVVAPVRSAPVAAGAPSAPAVLFGALGNGQQGEVRNDMAGTTQVEGGAGHLVGRRADGSAWAAGRNDYGQAGDSDESWDLFDITPTGLDIVDVAAGSLHTLLLGDDGSVWALGRNQCGQIGDGTTTNRDQPVEVTGVTDVVDIDADGNQSYALRSDGTVRHWGPDDFEVNCPCPVPATWPSPGTWPADGR